VASPSSGPILSRRRFFSLTGAGLGGLALAGCGGGTEEERAASKFFSDQTIIADGRPQRTVWSLTDDEGNLGDLAPHSIEYLVLDPAGTEIAAGLATKHIDGVAQPYYRVDVAFGEVGVHEFRFATDVHGRHVGFAVPGDPADTTLFWPGDAFPSIVTPTLDDDAGVMRICTRTKTCPFHSTSLDASIASDRPTVLIVTTPAFCGTVFMCGPVLEVLIEEMAASTLDVDVVHGEVYVDPDTDLDRLAPIVEASGVTYEPYLFVLDRDGVVTARLDHIWDRAELRAALELLS